MKTLRPWARIGICFLVGIVGSAIAGALLGYLYGTLEQPLGMFEGLRYLGVVVLPFYLAPFGGLLGLLIGIFNLRRLWGTLLGVAAGLLFVIVLLTLVNGDPTRPDEILMEAVVPALTLLGLLISSLSRLMPGIQRTNLPKQEEWQNRILTP